jgi:hypothetical protein
MQVHLFSLRVNSKSDNYQKQCIFEIKIYSFSFCRARKIQGVLKFVIWF